MIDLTLLDSSDDENTSIRNAVEAANKSPRRKRKRDVPTTQEDKSTAPVIDLAADELPSRKHRKILSCCFTHEKQHQSNTIQLHCCDNGAVCRKCLRREVELFMELHTKETERINGHFKHPDDALPLALCHENHEHSFCADTSRSSINSSTAQATTTTTTTTTNDQPARPDQNLLYSPIALYECPNIKCSSCDSPLSLDILQSHISPASLEILKTWRARNACLERGELLRICPTCKNHIPLFSATWSTTAPHECKECDKLLCPLGNHLNHPGISCEERRKAGNSSYSSHFECAICCDSHKIDEAFIIQGCQHAEFKVCWDQAREFSRHQLKNGKVPRCICTFHDICIDDLEMLLTSEELQKVDSMNLKIWLETNPIFFCQSADCKEAVDISESEGNNYWECSACSVDYCLKCKEKWHANVSCEAYQAWKKENDSSESEFQDLLRQGKVKKCPNCQSFCTKTDGCNYLRCSRCQCAWCWFCGAKHDVCSCGRNEHKTLRPNAVPMPFVPRQRQVPPPQNRR